MDASESILSESKVTGSETYQINTADDDFLGSLSFEGYSAVKHWRRGWKKNKVLDKRVKNQEVQNRMRVRRTSSVGFMTDDMNSNRNRAKGIQRHTSMPSYFARNSSFLPLTSGRTSS